MSAKHLGIIGFAYTFGYMIPTIRLIQILDRGQLYAFMAAYAIRCLACDLVFTIVLSKMMLQRNLFKNTSKISQGTAVLLAILAFYFNDNLTMKSSDSMPVPTNLESGATQYLSIN